jgi:glycosyltransferase involved in cell wall biosynthesis
MARLLRGPDYQYTWTEMPANALYLSFDGMTDALGRSQVLPYLAGLAAHGHEIRIVSLEKADAWRAGHAAVEAICRESEITWHPLPYRTNPPLLSAAANLRTLRTGAERIYRERPADLLHCRSYPPAVVGLRIKRWSGCPLIFDMRGFWADQRREGRRWSDRSILGRLLYRRWKQHEAELICEADHIVALTNAAKDVIEAWDSYRGAPISVIPCCADFELFRPSLEEEGAETRRELGFGAADPVLVYLGSVGTVYRLRDHVRLFAAIRRRDSKAKMLFVGRVDIDDIMTEAASAGISVGAEDFRVVQAERSEVPKWVSAGDVGTSFYTPTFYSLGVSPTKLAEYLACGVPVIANGHVGDARAILEATVGGHVIADFSAGEIERASNAFFELRELDREALRGRARPVLDLSRGIDAYRRIYSDLKTAVLACMP